MLEQDQGYDDDGSNDLEREWRHEAPEPQEVVPYVLTLVPLQVKRMGPRRLGEADHSLRMKLVLAAEFYYDCFEQVISAYLPLDARPVVDLHLRFARQILRVRTDGGRSGIQSVSYEV